MNYPMTYLDANILVYATLTHVDNPSQQDKALKVLHQVISKENLILSHLSLLEYVFVMKKAQEDEDKILNALELFQDFVKREKDQLTEELIQNLRNEFTFKNSFDIYHLAFANTMNCSKLLSFDRGFYKLTHLSKIKIEVIE